jgi:putative transposase
MAEEMNAGTAAESAAPETKTAAPKIKKTRAPRRPKTAPDTVATEAAAHAAGETAVKAPRAKRGPKTVKTKLPKAVVAKAGSKQEAVKPVEETLTTPVEALDDISVLIGLEEENKRLRKELSDKLRTENADLRRRLGKA